jgi:hypothetical protein
VAASVFAAYALARSKNLSLVEQRTGATLVALMLSLTVLVLVALPLTWRRALIVGAVAIGFVLLFPFSAVRSFFALRLPTTTLAATLLIAIAGMALMITVWIVSRRLDGNPDAAALAGGG